mgnify:CR=1 FL=1
MEIQELKMNQHTLINKNMVKYLKKLLKSKGMVNGVLVVMAINQTLNDNIIFLYNHSFIT